MKFLLYLFLIGAVVSTTALSADQNISQEKNNKVSELVGQMLSGKPTKAFETYAAELIEHLQDNKELCEQLKKTIEAVAVKPVSLMTAWQQYKLIASGLLALQSVAGETDCIVTEYMKKAYILMNFVPGLSIEELERKADQEIKEIAVAAYLIKKMKKIPASHVPAQVKDTLKKLEATKGTTGIIELLRMRLAEDNK